MKQTKFYIIIAIIGLLTSIILFNSCQKEDELTKQNPENNTNNFVKKDIYVNNGRLVFGNKSAMEKTFTLFNNQSDSANNEWCKQYNYTPLNMHIVKLKSLNEGQLDSVSFLKYNYIPQLLMPFVNEKCEIQTGDTIIWINNNIEYLIVNGDENLLSQVKQAVNNGIEKLDFKNLQIHEITKISYPDNVLQPNKNQLKSLHGGWSDARYQYQFTASNGHEYKIVHEIYIYQIKMFGYWTTCELHIKFEYWHHGWQRAGENVTKQIKNVFVYVKYGSTIQYKTINKGPVSNGDCLIGKADFPLYSIDYIKVSGEMKATVPQFNKTYNISGTLWERHF